MSLLHTLRITHTSTALRRLLLCACALILALQLMGSSYHEHDLAEQLSDCVSCQAAAHATADLPAVSRAPATPCAVLPAPVPDPFPPGATTPPVRPLIRACADAVTNVT
jgi:hypothetical protein